VLVPDGTLSQQKPFHYGRRVLRIRSGMTRSNSAAPSTPRTPTGAARLGAAVLRIPINIVRWIAVLARAPRAQVPPVGAAAFVAFGLVLAIVIASMFFFDTQAIAWSRRGPLWLHDLADEITNYGRSNTFLYPFGLVLLALATAQSPSLSRMSQSVLAALAVRFGFLFVAIGLPSLFATIVKRLIGRARPYVGSHDDPFAYMPFIWRPEYASMPSGHATTATAAAIAIGAVWPRLRSAMWLYALIIMATRILIFVHHPSDVLGGAIVGVIGALMVRRWFAARRLGFSPADLRPYAWPSWARMKAAAREIAGGRPGR
jgi:membrane-associated phospholipid phosphatase